MTFENHMARHGRIWQWLSANVEEVETWVSRVAAVSAAGGTLYVAGNGGSAADASHLVGELVGAYRDRSRSPIPAVCLNSELSSCTAIANDFGYQYVVARELSCLARAGDAFLAVSTSGRSPNVISPFFSMPSGVSGFCLGGRVPNASIAGLADSLWVGAGDGTEHDTPAIQEAHIIVLHYLAEVIEAVAS